MEPKKTIGFSSVAFEITRKCNFACEHCIRGDAQETNMSEEVIDAFFDQISELQEILPVIFRARVFIHRTCVKLPLPFLETVQRISRKFHLSFAVRGCAIGIYTEGGTAEGLFCNFACAWYAACLHKYGFLDCYSFLFGCLVQNTNLVQHSSLHFSPSVPVCHNSSALVQVL